MERSYRRSNRIVELLNEITKNQREAALKFNKLTTALSASTNDNDNNNNIRESISKLIKYVEKLEAQRELLIHELKVIRELQKAPRVPTTTVQRKGGKRTRKNKNVHKRTKRAKRTKRTKVARHTRKH